MSSPTKRSLEELRRTGWTVQVVERWIPQTRRRLDLFGCIDIIAIKEGNRVLGIQATTTGNMSKRLAKAKAEPRMATWMAVADFAVYGWSKGGKRGKRKLWCLKVGKVNEMEKTWAD